MTVSIAPSTSSPRRHGGGHVSSAPVACRRRQPPPANVSQRAAIAGMISIDGRDAGRLSWVSRMLGKATLLLSGAFLGVVGAVALSEPHALGVGAANAAASDTY